MIINTMLCLMIIGLSGFLRLRMRFDRLLSWLMLGVTVFLFYEYGIQSFHDQNYAFSFLWNKSNIGDITIDFHPLGTQNMLIVPIFFLSVITILNNNIFRNEEKRSSFNSLIILNFISLSLLICAKNYIQVVTALFVSDILGYLLIKDVDSSRRYVIYNFFANMCLYMILAMVCGKINSLEISRLLSYDQIGRHKDFVGIVTVTALWIKMGGYPFQSYLLDLSNSRFQRMSAANLLFAPLASALVLYKLHNLVTVSELSVPLLKILSGATFIAGILGMIIKDHIQKKVVYLNMSLFSILILSLMHNNFEWQLNFSYYIVFIYFINQMFFKIYLYQNREILVSRMLNCRKINVLPMKTLLLQIMVAMAVYMQIIWNISELFKCNYINIMGGILFLTICVILNHIYKSPYSRRLEETYPNPLRGISFFITTIILLIGSVSLKIYSINGVIALLSFLVLVSFPIFRKLRKLYTNQWLQQEDLSKSFFFYTLVTPFMYLSRNLWIFVDFVLSEKIITAGLSALNRSIISLFFKINRKNLFSELMYIIFGILVFVISFYRSLLP